MMRNIHEHVDIDPLKEMEEDLSNCLAHLDAQYELVKTLTARLEWEKIKHENEMDLLVSAARHVISVYRDRFDKHGIGFEDLPTEILPG